MAFEGSAVWNGKAGELRAPSAATLLQPMRPARPPTPRWRKAATDRASVAAETQLEALRRETGVLAHDLNNLLNVVLAASEAIAEGASSGSDTAELARMSQDAAEKGGALLRRLTCLSDPEHAPPVDCAEAALAAARRARVSATPSVMVEAQAAEEPLRCRLDSAELDSALLNLCVNAGHAMPVGGTLRLSARRVELDGAAASALGLPAGAYAALAVADTGEGMAPETLARAAEPYFTTRKGRGGTGLGLASVQAFAARAGGRLVLESEVGRGTTATLYLPLA